MADKKLEMMLKDRRKPVETMNEEKDRPLPPEEKLVQLNTIFYIGSRLSFHRRMTPDSEELQAVRQRWARLKRDKTIGGKKVS